jgi:hypothetical protein
MGIGPYGSPKIDSKVGAPQADIFYHYKIALMRATALDRATRVEEKKARREKRPINPDNIDRLSETSGGDSLQAQSGDTSHQCRHDLPMPI